MIDRKELERILGTEIESSKTSQGLTNIILITVTNLLLDIRDILAKSKE